MLIIVEIIGWAGVFMLGLHGVPQVVRSVRRKEVDDLSFWMLFFWCLGCICLLIYTSVESPKPLLILNYIWSATMSGTLLYIYLKYRSKKS